MDRTTHTEGSGMNADGYHFVRRGSTFIWVHPLEMQDGDEDCSLMSDAEFEACVRKATGE
jgi:hypothetical protein